MQRRSSESSDDQAEILLQLSGAYFNGALAQYDSQLSFKYLLRSANCGSHVARLLSLTFARIAEHKLKPSFERSIGEAVREAGRKLSAGGVIDLRNLRMPIDFQILSVVARVWATEYSSDYEKWVHSDQRLRQTFNTLSALKLYDSMEPQIFPFLRGVDHEERATPENKSTLALDSLRSYNGRSDYCRYEDLSIEDFLQDMKERSCVNVPTNTGFTILHLAVLHRDSAMIELLLSNSLLANVNEEGGTPGWTPLWLSVITGQTDIAQILLSNGADVKAKDSKHGASILHMLNQISHPDALDSLLNTIFASEHAGLSIDELSADGLTPLHATFCGWDYSCGHAARALLKKGADPTVHAPDEKDTRTPIGLCVAMLDVDLLEQMLDCPSIKRRANQARTKLALADAKAEAYRFLLSRTRWHLASVVGEKYMDNIRQIMSLIVDEEMLEQFRVHPLGLRDTDLLYQALVNCRTHIVETLLHQISVTNSGAPLALEQRQGRPHLHAAIEYGQRASALLMLRMGVDLLERNTTGETALHLAARCDPSFLTSLIEWIKEFPMPGTSRPSIKEALTQQRDDGNDVCTELLLNGGQDEIRLAEKLRTTYRLDLDAFSPVHHYGSTTMTGRLIMNNMIHGLIPIETLHYLLRLVPPPRFVCTEQGDTLLTLTIRGNPSE